MAVGGAGVGLKGLSAVPRPSHRMIVLAAILLVASLLRLHRLGQSSLWYDEVVTMRLAQTQSPLKLLRLLHEIDATRAPLHPLLLQCWVKLFSPSEYAGRGFSVLCGTVAIAIVYWIGIQAFDGAQVCGPPGYAHSVHCSSITHAKRACICGCSWLHV